MPSQHKTIMAVDIAGYNDPKRTTAHLLVVHKGFWDLMRTSFAEAGIPWDVCFRENTGDGAMIQLPVEVAKADLVTRLPDHLLAGLRRYNATKADEAKVRLRIALHAGEVHQGSDGTVSQATSFTFRILEAPDAKSALKESGAAFALIVSDSFYREVVKQDAAADPVSYQRIPVEVKETRTEAWLRLVGAANGLAPLPRGAVSTAPGGGRRRASGGSELSLDQILELTELLLAVPTVADDGSRQVLLQLAPARDPRDGAASASGPLARPPARPDLRALPGWARRTGDDRADAGARLGTGAPVE